MGWSGHDATVNWVVEPSLAATTTLPEALCRCRNEAGPNWSNVDRATAQSDALSGLHRQGAGEAYPGTGRPMEFKW
eukprot:3935905-Rhodomonas_salina.5